MQPDLAAPPRPERAARRFPARGRIARSALSLALLGVILALAGPGEVVRPLASADPRWVVASLALLTLDRWLMAFKWTRLLRSGGIHVPVLTGLKIYCASMMWGLLLPSTLGADAVRTYLTARRGIAAPVVVASILVERGVGFIASLAVGLLGLGILDSAGLLDAGFTGIGPLGVLALAAAVAAFVLSLHRGLFEALCALLPPRLRASRLAARALELQGSYAGFGASRRALAGFLALTLLEQFTTIVGTWFTALAVHVDVSLWFIAGVLPLTLLVARLPISVAGLGVYEGIFVLLMRLGGVQPAAALSIVLVGWLLQLASWLPWWLAEFLESGPLPAASRAPLAVKLPTAELPEP